MSKPPKENRVLLFSQRNLYEPEVWRCPFNEFEKIVQKVDMVDLVAPKPTKWYQQRRNNAMRVGKYSSIALNPGIPKTKLEKDYDLFFAVCEKPSELLNIATVEKWKGRCKTSICWMTEFWIKEISLLKSSLRVLSEFDHVLLTFSQSIEPLRKKIGSQCSFLPSGADAILFAPTKEAQSRPIDIYSYGRRSEQVHKTLLKIAKETGIFYIYDTLSELRSFNLRQHRLLTANILKRSRYCIVNPGKFDVPGESGDQSEMGTRYFEGAAAGAIMIGEQPRNDEFEKRFCWPGAVIQLPDDAEGIEGIISDLDLQPDRIKQIRKNNLIHSFMHNDWIYRWEEVLKIAGLETTPAMEERKERLKEIADNMEIQ